MRISKLHLVNFRSHAETVLDLERLTVIRGANHVGKSSIEQALEFNLAGRSESTGDNGQGATDLIRFGQDKASVTCQLVSKDGDVREVRASLTRKSGRDFTVTKPGDKGWDATEWKSWLTSSRDILSCLINNRYFVDQKAADQKNILAGLILPDVIKIPDDKLELVNKLEVPTGNPAEPSTQSLDAMYDRVFALRRDAKRDLGNLNVITMEGDAPDVEDIKKRLNERRAELTKAQNERTALLNEYAQTQSQCRQADEHIAKLERRLESELREREQLETRLLSTAEHKKQKAIADKDSNARDLDERIAATTALIEEKRNQLGAAELLEPGKGCPTCAQTLTEGAYKALFEPIAAEKSKHEVKLRDLYEQRKAIGDFDTAKRKIADHTSATEDIKRINNRIREIETELSGAKNERNSIVLGAAPDSTEIDARIADLNDRVSKGTEVLEKASRQAALVGEAKKSMARQKELEERVAGLETLVEFFGPNGIKATLLAENIGTFQNSLNAVLNRWGYHCKLSIEPYSFLVYEWSSESPAALHLLSKSERYRFSVAFQVALAIASGFNFVVVDEADILDEPGRNALNGALYESQLEQAIILATDPRTNVAPLPGSTFITLTREANKSTVATVLGRTPAQELVAQ